MIHERNLADTIGGVKIKRTKVNGFIINYTEVGSGKPIILLHGLNIGWGQWYKNMSDLARDFRVFALDMPGSGGSTKFDATTSNMEHDLVETVEKFIERLGLKDVNIVGHSIGGWVALRIALRKNCAVEKIVLSNSLGLADHVPLRHIPVTIPFLAKLLSLTVVAPTKKNMVNFLKGVCHDDNSVEEKFSNYYHESIHRGQLSHPLMVMNHLFRPFGLREEFVLIPYLNTVENPVLVVVGSHDFLVPQKKVESVIDSLKNGRIIVIENAGHVPFIESPSEWNSAIRRFISNKK